jgi:uncharacterized membrane protein
LYYAHVVGMTSAGVSGVQVTSREMRHLTPLVHSVLSFGFNMLILAPSASTWLVGSFKLDFGQAAWCR